MSDVDLLFDVRNNYYLGAYQQCINEAQNAKVKTDQDKLERDTFLYRSYIALGKMSIPLNEITTNAPTALKAVRRFADYMANPAKRSKIAAEVEAEVNGSMEPDNVNLILAAQILSRHNVGFLKRLLVVFIF
uniref:Coatomer subunit epsilon n=1 Tax=Panagrolaimus sp. JU765 TaxID=591449 RepID=A0AC34R6R1_9BILA